MICVHADWYIGDEAGFREVLTQAAEAAVRFNALVTVGIVPSRADPGFGYIQPGDATTPSSSARKVQQFVEKPDREGAARMCAEGYLWNSGIFVWTVACFLEQLRQHTPEVAPALGDGLSSAEFFSRVQSVSVDVGVLERSGSVLVVPGEFGWDDIGTWSALKRVLPTDSAGNATRGVAHAVDSHRNVVYSPDSVVVLYGVDDLVVVCESDVTLVTTMDRSADLKQLLQRLPPEVSSR
jgi:mannose-1-phosphate guanylyltransferase